MRREAILRIIAGAVTVVMSTVASALPADEEQSAGHSQDEELLLGQEVSTH